MGKQWLEALTITMSAIALGKFLTEQGLRDEGTKTPSQRAISEGYAIETPLKSGQFFFMWNKKKIEKLLEDEGVSKATSKEYHTSVIVAAMRELLRDTGNDKLDRIAYQVFPSELAEQLGKVGKDIRQDVRKGVMAELKRLKLIGEDETA